MDTSCTVNKNCADVLRLSDRVGVMSQKGAYAISQRPEWLCDEEAEGAAAGVAANQGTEY